MQRAWILVTSRMEADNDLFQFSRNHQRSEEPIFRWRGKKHWFKIKSFGCNIQFTFKEQARFHEDFNHCYKDKVKLSTRFIWTENTIIAWTVERNCQNRCIYYVLHLMRLVIEQFNTLSFAKDNVIIIPSNELKAPDWFQLHRKGQICITKLS